MGYPGGCYHVVLPNPFLCLIQLIKFAVATVYFCCLSSSSQDLTPTVDNIPLTPKSVKSKLPVIDFASLYNRSNLQITCMICLGWLEAKDEVRELGNCCHGFHRRCIDRWVELGRVECPLCRTRLLPLPELVKGDRSLIPRFIARIW